MTHGDTSGYWAAVAQIVPVLALAFVIEARLITQRMSKKNAYRYRGRRVRVALLLFVLGLLLTISEIAALQSFVIAPQRLLGTLDYMYLVFSYIAVVGSIIFVVYYPISAMVAASTSDVFQWVRFHVPWGTAQRLKRDMLRQQATLDHLIREGVGHRLAALTFVAATLLDRSLDVRELQQVILRAIESEPDFDIIDRGSEVRKIANSDPFEPGWAYRVTRRLYDTLVEQDRAMRRHRKQTRKHLKRLELVTRADSKEFTRIQRASMALAAKRP